MAAHIILLHRDPTVIADIENDESAIAHTIVRQANILNAFDTSQSLYQEIDSYYRQGLHYQSNYLREGHRLLVFQSETDTIGLDPLGIEFGHFVRGHIIVVNRSKCYVCRQTLQNIKKCNRCRLAYYCSRECQSADFPVHKRLCKMVYRDRLEKNRGLDTHQHDEVVGGTH